MDNKILVTIGREYGSGGKLVGELLAKDLGINYYDKELIVETAKESGLHEDILREYDEQSKKLFFSYSVGGDYSNDLPLDSRVFLAQFETIKKIAARESAVFIGRCADYILREQKECLNVFINASVEVRAQRLTEVEGLSMKEAQKRIDKNDKRREDYYEYFTGRDWRDIRNYDLCINTGLLGIDNAVELIKKAIEIKQEGSNF